MSTDDHPTGHQRTGDVEQGLLGQRIREAREYLGLSQELVAKHLGIPRASVSAMEAGKRKVSSLELKELAHLLKQPVTYFLEEQEHAMAGQDDPTCRALFRTTRALSDEDRRQVLRFAQFLRQAGQAPAPGEE